MNLHEAAEKALASLWYFRDGFHWDKHHEAAYQALRAALAEAEEPVAWYYEREGESAISFAPDRDPDKPWQPLFTHPPRQEPVTETKCKRAICQRASDGYCAPCHEGYYP